MKVLHHTSRFLKRVLVISIVNFFLFGSFVAQEASGNYPFIKYELNHLYFSKDSSAFLKFYKKLDALKIAKIETINLVHIGGSHVQGGTWSNTFLSHFQTENKTVGGGYFVFPYKIAKTNEQPYASSFSNGKWKRCRAIGKEFCLPIGMSALSIISNDSANYFGVMLTKKSACKYVNNVKVYHNFNPSFEFNTQTIKNEKVTRTDYKQLGYSLFKFDMPIDSICFNLIRKDTLQKDFIIYGFSLENNLTSGFYLAGLGANGASSSTFLKCLDFTSQLESIRPDLVILSLGVNDTQSKGFEKEDYIEHYDSLIMNIKKANPDVAIILTTTTDNFIKRKTSNKRTIKAQEAMFELMQKHNVAVWDLFLIMGGYKSMTKWNKAGLASRDRVHFTSKGYTILGNLMYEAINKSYNANKQQLKN